MNEMDFRIWLSHQGINKKVSSDLVSRLKRLEKEVKTTGKTGGLHQPLKGVITGLTSEEVLKV